MGRKVRFKDDPAVALVADYARRLREAKGVAPKAPPPVARAPQEEPGEAREEEPGEAREEEPAGAREEAREEEARGGALAALGRARVPLALAAVAVLAAGALWWRWRAAPPAAEAAAAAEALAAEGEVARYEAEVRRYEAERERLRAEHGALVAQRDAAVAAARRLHALAQDTSRRMDKRYAPSKETYDSDMAAYEDEQSLETAFALKGELDDKKSKEIAQSAELAKQHAAAVGHAKALQAQLAALARHYNESFDDQL
jgi:hypothetical protein